MVPHQKTEPLSEREVASLMEMLGPFEDKPHIAVAVSGGADSLALTLLADAWVRQKGGQITALSVDHGLRRGSALEAEQVASWLAPRNIEHRVLTWTGEKPDSGLQAAARTARYRLLGDWCRRAGVLHLLLAHHQEDQAETFLLRLKRNSGIDGLAAMSAVVEKSDMRLLRPLLNVPKNRLRATLEAASQPWLEDPSNENTAFGRVRIRKSLPELAAAGITVKGLAGTASLMARARIALEAGASSLLGECCSLDPAGFARLDGNALFSGPDEISLRVLSRTLMCIGGGEYSPHRLKLERLHEKMKGVYRDDVNSWKGATLGRCRMLALNGGTRNTQFLVCRENRSLPEPVDVSSKMKIDWDNRFHLYLRTRKVHEYKGVRLLALGSTGWTQLLEQAPEIRSVAIPYPVRVTLPALFDVNGVFAVPHLNYSRGGMNQDAPGFTRVNFHPRQSLSGTGFLVAE